MTSQQDKKSKGQKKAVAVRYDRSQDDTPKVIGKGKGLVAEKIIQIAKEQGITIHENPDLVEVLAKLNINQEIPEDTYLVVAEILAFVYRTNEKYKGRQI